MLLEAPSYFANDGSLKMEGYTPESNSDSIS